LLEKKIATVVIGKNDNWKDKIDLGKQTNQNFVCVPHCRLIEIITYKCQLVGIKVIIQEESYTSLASFLNLDPMPVYGKEQHVPVFTGKRIKRGLYKTKVGKLCNSDVNGSYNILRKAFPKAFSDGIESCVIQPRRINLSKKQ
jgi:IS605 OrfB family transposase